MLNRSQDERTSLALLRAGRLIRSTGRAESDEVETYHDRVRETVVAHLEPEVSREHHRRLALVLEARRQADPEVLGVHFLGAGLPERAVDYFAQAADQAAEALAFERAAASCTAAHGAPGRESPDLTGPSGRAWATPWPTPAAGPRLRVPTWRPCRGATVAEALELQRRAAMQFLISGHIDEGLAALASRARDGGHDAAGHSAPVAAIAPVAEAAAAASRPGFPRARPQRDRRRRA